MLRSWRNNSWSGPDAGRKYSRHDIRRNCNRRGPYAHNLFRAGPRGSVPCLASGRNIHNYGPAQSGKRIYYTRFPNPAYPDNKFLLSRFPRTIFGLNHSLILILIVGALGGGEEDHRLTGMTKYQHFHIPVKRRGMPFMIFFFYIHSRQVAGQPNLFKMQQKRSTPDSLLFLDLCNP